MTFLVVGKSPEVFKSWKQKYLLSDDGRIFIESADDFPDPLPNPVSLIYLTGFPQHPKWPEIKAKILSLNL